MSTIPQNNDENQEIDLSAISKKIGSFFEEISTKIFKSILFFKKNIVVISILLLSGLALGIYLDIVKKTYLNEIIVTPNYGSTDYLYSKVNLLNSKIEEGDTLFLKNVVGIKKAEYFSKITIIPIIDVYKFIDSKPENFEFIKLLGEDGDIKKIVREDLTSKNYPFHSISFETKKKFGDKDALTPILDYINNSDYFKKVQKETLFNLNSKIAQNDSIINQIDGFLNGFSDKINSNQKSDKLIYYNENTQLNDVIKTKETLINEKGTLRLKLVNSDKIVKEISIVTNIEKLNGINGNKKFLVPLIFLSLFLFYGFFKSFYKKQLLKIKN